MESFVACAGTPARDHRHGQGRRADRRGDHELVPLLDEGDIVIDCGNAHYLDTRRREQELREHGIHFVGCGVSGGEEGALNGPSIMPGGSKQSYEKLGPIFESIAAQVDGTPVLRARRPGRCRATSSRWCTTASSTPTCS